MIISRSLPLLRVSTILSSKIHPSPMAWKADSVFDSIIFDQLGTVGKLLGLESTKLLRVSRLRMLCQVLRLHKPVNVCFSASRRSYNSPAFTIFLR